MNQIQKNIPDDGLLLQQLEQGSKEAFNVLFEKYWEQAYSTAYRRVKEHDAAKDIVQEIFTYIWINRETAGIKSLPAYLHTAIRNKVIKYLARQKPIGPFLNSVETISEKNYQADAPLLWKEYLKSYEELLDSLPPRKQEVFRLRYQEGLPTEKIALKLGISRKAVQNQLGEAVKTLKVYLSRIYGVIFTFPAILFLPFALSF